MPGYLLFVSKTFQNVFHKLLNLVPVDPKRPPPAPAAVPDKVSRRVVEEDGDCERLQDRHGPERHLVRGARGLAVWKDVLNAKRELEREQAVVSHVDEEHGKKEEVDGLATRTLVGSDAEGQDQVGREAETHDKAKHDDPDPAAHGGRVLDRRLLEVEVKGLARRSGRSRL